MDSSAVVKRYILEEGSQDVQKIYHKALNGDLNISFSVWNIGEVLGVFDRYRRRGWIEEADYGRARAMFISEVKRLVKLRLLRLVPVKTSLLIRSWRIVEKYHIYQADALQIESAKWVRAGLFVSGDKRLVEVAASEGLNIEPLT